MSRTTKQWVIVASEGATRPALGNWSSQSPNYPFRATLQVKAKRGWQAKQRAMLKLATSGSLRCHGKFLFENAVRGKVMALSS